MNIKNNFWQRISWLSQRWRTQRNAISSVNCRIQWIIESLNAHCASLVFRRACPFQNHSKISHPLFLPVTGSSRAVCECEMSDCFGLFWPEQSLSKNWCVCAPTNQEAWIVLPVRAEACICVYYSLCNNCFETLWEILVRAYVPNPILRTSIQHVVCSQSMRVVPITWSEIGQENPLNLSISISGGKETNKDSPSNGEWSGNSSNLKSRRGNLVRIVV